MNKNTILSLIPWGLNKIRIAAAYLLAAYIILGTSFTLVSDLTVTNLNIIFAMGIVIAGILVIPAIMSSDSGPSTSSNIFIITVLSYPVVYIISLVASRWIPIIASNSELSILFASMPIINILLFVVTIIRVLLKGKFNS